MNNRYIVALEFSGSQVKGAFAKTSDPQTSQISTPTVEAIKYEEKTECVQYGRVQNILDATRNANTVLQKLENDPKLKHGRISCAYVGLSGRSLGSVQTSGEIILPEQMLITEDILHKLLVEATKTISAEKKVLKVVPRKFVIDNQVNNNPVGSVGTSLKGEFTVVTCNPANRNNLDLVLKDKLNMPVKEYVVTPLALADLLLGEEEKQLGCVLVDIGAQTTTIAIYKDRALQYLATLPLGSYNITHDIATGMSLTLERAEDAKIQKGDAAPDVSALNDNEYISRINCYVQARAGEIIANIIAHIDFANYKPANLPAGFILTGRGSKLKNFSQALEAQSKMKTRLAKIPGSINVTDHTVEPEDYASILAILLHGAKKSDSEGCVVFSQADEEAIQEADTVSAAVDFQGYDPSNEDDDFWINDSDKEKKLRQQKARKEEELRAKQEAKEAARKAKEEKEKEKEQKDKDKPKKSILKGIQSSIYKFFVEDSEDDDIDLNDKA